MGLPIVRNKAACGGGRRGLLSVSADHALTVTRRNRSATGLALNVYAPAPRQLVIHNHSEITGVVLQVIVIYAEKQAAGTSDPDGAAIVADKKVIIRSFDSTNESRARTVRHRTGRVIG